MEFQQKRTSKTLWFNIISIIVLTIPVILTALKTIEPGWALLADSIGGMIVGICNIVIRTLWTDKPLDTVRNRQKALDQSGDVYNEYENPQTTAERLIAENMRNSRGQGTGKP